MLSTGEGRRGQERAYANGDGGGEWLGRGGAPVLASAATPSFKHAAHTTFPDYIQYNVT